MSAGSNAPLEIINSALSTHRGTGGTSKGYPAARILYSLVPVLFGNKGVLTGEITSDRIWRCSTC